MTDIQTQGEDPISMLVENPAVLEPCPHCGPMPASPEAIQDHLGYWRVICGPCGSSSGTLPEGERWPDARQRVIDGWNKRHSAGQSAMALIQNDCQGEDPTTLLIGRLKGTAEIYHTCGQPDPDDDADDAAKAQMLRRDAALMTEAAAMLQSQAEEQASTKAILQDSVAIHRNMLHGTIAKISMVQCAHTHGVQFNDLEAAEAKLAETSQERDRLREAVEPFADLDKIWPQAVGYWEFTVDAFAEGADRTADFTGDDLRRARAALQKEPS